MLEAFLLTPLREGRQGLVFLGRAAENISTHAPAGGATGRAQPVEEIGNISTHAPAGGATGALDRKNLPRRDFYSRPCGRGDSRRITAKALLLRFLLTPLREGRRGRRRKGRGEADYFYSRPCGRGDPASPSASCKYKPFLLTPLREGRQARWPFWPAC